MWVEREGSKALWQNDRDRNENDYYRDSRNGEYELEEALNPLQVGCRWNQERQRSRRRLKHIGRQERHALGECM
jgi:hypothetical protein